MLEPDFNTLEMTIEDFMSYYDRVKRTVRMQRAGQCAMNCLHELRPDLASEIRGTERDPFYRDAQLVAFSIWLERRLRVAQSKCSRCGEFYPDDPNHPGYAEPHECHVHP